MSKKCFNCGKEFPLEKYGKHEIECNSHFYQNEMENLIPCDKCQNLIIFEEYSDHINLCGYENPIFYIPFNIPNINTSSIQSNIAIPIQSNTESNIASHIQSNTESNTEVNLQENINTLLNHHNILLNLLNSINGENQTDEYEELSLLDGNKVIKGIKIDDYSKELSIKEGFDCPVCFEKEEEFREIKCSHIVCIECCKEWFLENNKCPICMVELESDK